MYYRYIVAYGKESRLASKSSWLGCFFIAMRKDLWESFMVKGNSRIVEIGSTYQVAIRFMSLRRDVMYSHRKAVTQGTHCGK